MVLRKISIDNSVRYIPKKEQNPTKNEKQSEQIQSIAGGGKPNTRKQNKKFSENNKKFVKDFTAGGFGILKWMTNCYF